MDEKQEIENEEQSNNQIGFFKKVQYSVTNFEKYPEMAAEGVLSSLKYLVKLMAIFSVILAAGLVYQLHTSVQGIADYIQNSLPDITYSDGELKVDSQEPITIQDSNQVVSKIIIDTNVEDQTQIDEYVASIGTEESGIVILKDKAIVKTSAVSETTIYTYTDLISSVTDEDVNNITKQDIVGFLTGSSITSIYSMFFVVMFIYVLAIYLISTLVDSLVLAILGNITSLLAKLKLKFSAVFNMAVYGLTLSIILNAIYIVQNMFTGYEIKFFQVMYVSIAYIYLAAAIFIIRADHIKRQAELTKIKTVQEQVKEEMEREKEKEEDKSENKKEPKEKEKKEDETEKSDKDEQEPQGSGA